MRKFSQTGGDAAPGSLLSSVHMTYLGEILSVAAAVFWALAIVLFKKSGEHTHPVALNTFKNILATLLFLPTIYITGGTLFHDASVSEYVLLAVSGVIGIAIGDSLLFKSLNVIGAGPSALVNMLYSPATILLSFLFLDERLTIGQFFGVLMILLAVLESTRVKGSQDGAKSERLRGIAIGVTGVICMVVGVVMIKPVLDDAPLLWAIEIRLIGGVFALLLFFLFNENRGPIARTLLVKGSRRFTVVSSVLGGYFAMTCWLGGIKFALASVASALNQTNAIFILIFAWLILKEQITVGRWIAIVIAVGGAIMVTFLG